jgi:hypothetical protein
MIWNLCADALRSTIVNESGMNHDAAPTILVLCEPNVRVRNSSGSRCGDRLSRADYVSHKGDRPISSVWKLRRPMPADFFRQVKVASG